MVTGHLLGPETVQGPWSLQLVGWPAGVAVTTQAGVSVAWVCAPLLSPKHQGHRVSCLISMTPAVSSSGFTVSLVAFTACLCLFLKSVDI